jgi:FkbM family methyltransferase
MSALKRNFKSFVLAVTPGKLLIQLKKMHYLRELQRFSEDDLQVVKMLVKRDQHVIDVGANVGWYTNMLSQFVGPRGRVYSIEPMPPTFSILASCVKKLQLMNVELINCAASDQDGEVLMETPTLPSGGENYYRARIIASDSATNSLQRAYVKRKSIDSLASGSLKISFVKCDVEGHEWAVVQGAKRMIGQSKPAWLIEISGNPDASTSDAAALLDYFRGEGYGVFWYDGQTLRPRNRGDRSINYFLLTSDHLETLKRSGLQIAKNQSFEESARAS